MMMCIFSKALMECEHIQRSFPSMKILDLLFGRALRIVPFGRILIMESEDVLFA